MRSPKGARVLRSDNAEGDVSDAGSCRTGSEHHQPNAEQLGLILCLCDGDGATGCLVHERISHFDTDTITADAADQQPLISEISASPGIEA